MICFMPPILQMMSTMTQKSCPNGTPERPKIDWKTIRKPMQNLNASWHRFFIDFGTQDGPENRPQISQKSILGAQGDPKAAQKWVVPRDRFRIECPMVAQMLQKGIQDPRGHQFWTFFNGFRQRFAILFEADFTPNHIIYLHAFSFHLLF